jgi:hypothetical protein
VWHPEICPLPSRIGRFSGNILYFLEDRVAVTSVIFPYLREHMDADFRVPPSTILEDRQEFS